MTNTRADARENNGKRQRIVSDLRRMILDGEIAPGEKVPSSEKLQEACGVTGVAIGRAMRRLAADE